MQPVLLREVPSMTLTVLDPRTGKRVTINLPDEPIRTMRNQSAPSHA